MRYTTVTYKDGNRECGAVYYGVTEETARELFLMEFPESKDRELFAVYHED